MESNLGVLAYRCPKTSQDVTTSIDTSALALTKLQTMKISVACPHCIDGHSIPANEMYFDQKLPRPALGSYSIPPMNAVTSYGS